MIKLFFIEIDVGDASIASWSIFFSFSSPFIGEALALLDLVFVGDFEELPIPFPFFVGEWAKVPCFLVEVLIVSLFLRPLSSLYLLGELKKPLLSSL